MAAYKHIHQSFLKSYATPNVHYTYDEAPVAFLQREDSDITPEIEKHASESFDSPVSSALAGTTKTLKPETIDTLLKNTTVRPTALAVLFNNPGITTDNLRTAWKEVNRPGIIYSDNIDKRYNITKVLAHRLVPMDILNDAFNNHNDPEVRDYAKWMIKRRT